MLTAWGKKLCAMANAVGSNAIIPYPNPSLPTDAMIAAKAVNDEDVYINNQVDASSNSFISSTIAPTGNNASAGVAVGSGTTQATENDNKLEQQITGLTAGGIPTIQLYYDKTNWKICARLDYSLSNNTGASVTISEIGLFRRFYTASTRGSDASSSARRSILVDRTVLAQPITIPNGGVATVRYEFVYDA